MLVQDAVGLSGVDMDVSDLTSPMALETWPEPEAMGDTADTAMGEHRDCGCGCGCGSTGGAGLAWLLAAMATLVTRRQRA